MRIPAPSFSAPSSCGCAAQRRNRARRILAAIGKAIFDNDSEVMLLTAPAMMMLGAVLGLQGIEFWLAAFGTSPESYQTLGVVALSSPTPPRPRSASFSSLPPRAHLPFSRPASAT